MSIQGYAKLAVFMGGVVGLGVELAAERLLAPAFGTTLDLWSIIIGLTFTALSAGYEIGGRIIDRRPTHRVLSVCLLIAGGWSLLISLLGRTIVDAIQELTFDFGGLRLGIFLSVLLLITVPPFVIGIITPASIRLVVPRVGAAGSSAGTIYALGTIGSLLGTFLPVIVLIPRIGVRFTFLSMAIVGLASGAIGLTNLVRNSATELVANTVEDPAGERVAQ
ncbi:MAG TPA: fused MFS/spermidine synthase [Thermomicrobiales bacterium]|nr:fused MFS/spermidine synthase [Thermomicrobiales bacterium]